MIILANNILKQMVLQNTVENYLTFLIIIVGSIFTLKIMKKLLLKTINKFFSKTSNSFLKIIDKRIFPLIYISIFYAAINKLKLTPTVDKIIDFLLLIIGVFYVGLLIQEIAIYLFRKYWNKTEHDSSSTKVFNILITFIRIFTWILAILFILDNLEVKITGLITGLGVGGIAVAFAAQSFLSDIFSYFTLFFDRPFDIGDFIIIGEYRGTVEHIGIKTTRIRSLSGEELVFPNSDLTNSRISNYKRMERRRGNFSFGVVYDTEPEKLREIPKIVENIIKEIENTEFDRAHFSSYGDFSLIFNVVYYITDSDYKLYMDIQQKINLRIKEEFSKKGIKFAYPTQTIYVNQSKLLTKE